MAPLDSEPLAQPSRAGVAELPASVSRIIEQSANPSRVDQYFREFQARHPAQYIRCLADTERLGWLAVLFCSSRFLSEELLKHPDWILDISDLAHALGRDDYARRLREFLSQNEASKPGTPELAQFRRRELVRVAIRDLAGRASLEAITSELSSLADAILSRALSEAEAELTLRFGQPLVEAPGRTRAVFCVLALGKLGGCELNYSSDIDLMFLYSGNGETSGPSRISNREFFKKVANHLTSQLSNYTPAGQCYRVDLRLRPEGSHGEICISLAAARDYYQKRARDWELQMLLKARVAAGDEALGRALLDPLAPLIYSTTLDFSLVEALSETRQRIREKAAAKVSRVPKVDVKLTRGGIRDIEFVTQCLQRLHGNRQNAVKGAGTLSALCRLYENDLLSATEYSRLTNAYRFLRTVEHLLQLEDDRQTHTLPTDSSELESFARRLFRPEPTNQIAASVRLRRELNQHLENVQAIYERIVHAQRPLYYNAPLTYAGPQDPASQPDDTHASALSQDLLDRLREAAPELAARLHAAGARSLKNGLADFLEGLLENPPDLKLFASHAGLRNWALQLFELSPLLSRQLVRYPELLAEIQRAADYPGRRYAFEALAAPLTDIEGLRWFFQREMFRTQVASVCLPEPVFKTLDQTSALAEFIIARAYRIALEMALDHARRHSTNDKPFEDPQNELMVVALGRLGMREFDLGSDADLLFIVPDEEIIRQRFWTRVVERLLEILSGYSEGGPIVSVDTRLRPEGREGPLVQSESKYVDYFDARAEAWEGIAYMKARAVAGDTDRATKFLTRLQQVDWRRYGQSGRSKFDLRQMRWRLQREQGAYAPLKAGQGGYYDADFILMYLRLRGAGMFFKSLNTPERIDVVEKMGHLERADAEFLSEVTTYFRALDHALRLVTGHTEGRISDLSVDQRQMTAELMSRWITQKSDARSLEMDLLSLQTRMHRLFERVFS